jgi:uncharacterized protein YuzE
VKIRLTSHARDQMQEQEDGVSEEQIKTVLRNFHSSVPGRQETTIRYVGFIGVARELSVVAAWPGVATEPVKIVTVYGLLGVMIDIAAAHGRIKNVTNPAPAPQFEPSTLQLRIDFDADAAYIRLSHERVAGTRRFDGLESVLVKLDAEGKPVGVEVLGLNTELPFDRLAQTFNFSESLIVSLKQIQQQLRGAVWATGIGDALVASPA